MAAFRGGNERDLSLDGIRAYAVLVVFAYHLTSHLPGGWSGVDVFFVLSGFLITNLLLVEERRTQRIRLGNFYARRAVRLLPALVTVLVLTVAVGWWRAAPGGVHNLWLAAASGLGYFANFRDLDPARMPLLGHLWSLSLEEQFYLTWPPILLVLLAWGVTLRRLAVALTVLAVAVSVYGVVLYSHGASVFRIGAMPDTHSMGLLLGCALAVIRFANPQFGTRHTGVTQAVAMAFVPAMFLLLILDRGNAFQGYGGYLLVSAGAVVLLLERLVAPTPMLTRMFEADWAVWLGQRSYEFYLVHLPILLMLNRAGANPVVLLLVGLPLSLAVCDAIHRLWLGPQQRWRRRLAGRNGPQSETQDTRNPGHRRGVHRSVVPARHARTE